MFSLQTGMRGAFGKPQGTVARVNIGQILLSVRCKDVHKKVVIEALRRSKFKFPGRQKIVISRNWGFTNLTREEYLARRQDGTAVPDGCYVKYINNRGPLDVYFKRISA